jgi:hypothetical protein
MKNAFYKMLLISPAIVLISLLGTLTAVAKNNSIVDSQLNPISTANQPIAGATATYPTTQKASQQAASSQVIADASVIGSQSNNQNEDIDIQPMSQVTSISELSDVKPTDWAFEAVQSLVERYGCIQGYADSTYRGNRALSRYEFAASLNSCLNRISEIIATGTNDLIRKDDLAVLQKLQQDFAVELTTLRGRLDVLEARTATLENHQFSPTTRLNAQIITAVSDTFGNRVGGDRDRSQPYFGDRARLNLESSFTGKDLLRVRLEFGNFLNANGTSRIASVTGTGMTRLNFDTDSDNILNISHVRYYFPVSDSVSFVVGPIGIGYTDITSTVTPPTIADDGNGVPSLFGIYDPLFRRGGGGAAVNWKLSEELTLTLGYLADNPNVFSEKGGLFDGGYNALAHLVYQGENGGFGVAFSHGYAVGGKVGITGGTGSTLAGSPFGDSIATSNNIVSTQGYYQFSPHFQIHAWGGYIWANAENSAISEIPNGRGETDSLLVRNGDNANLWYGAVGISFPDVGGRGNLPGILFGLPPRVSNSDVRKDRDNSYHIEAFYRCRLNDHISVTPGFWVIVNPENNSKNDTQYVGALRTTFDF